MTEFLFLDLDDTILDFHKAERIALSKTLREFGVEPTEEVLALYHKINLWHWEQLENWDSERVLLDVRTVEEYERGHLKGAINIPVDDLRNQLDALPEEREIWVYCQAGIRGYVAQRILMQRGFSRVYNLSGGYGLLEQIGYLEGKDQA